MQRVAWNCSRTDRQDGRWISHEEVAVNQLPDPDHNNMFPELSQGSFLQNTEISWYWVWLSAAVATKSFLAFRKGYCRQQWCPQHLYSNWISVVRDWRRLCHNQLNFLLAKSLFSYIILVLIERVGRPSSLGMIPLQSKHGQKYQNMSLALIWLETKDINAKKQ